MESRLGFILMLGLLIMTAIGCGGGDQTAASEGEEKAAAETAEKEKPDPWLKGPAREFLSTRIENADVTFGREASKAERAQASRTITAWMRARAAKHFVGECRYFSKKYIKFFVDEDAAIISRGKATTCPKALSFFGSRASGSFRNNLTGPIDSLRIGEGHGYALYHGNDGRNWDLPLDRENGKWWVALAAPTPLER